MSKYYRSVPVAIMKNWIGLKESDDSFKVIRDIYNDIAKKLGLHQITKTESWCAATVSAAMHKAGYDDIFPTECSCGRMIEKAKEMGIWKETDSHVPSMGDCILYDWQDTGKGDNTGWPDHIGMISECVNGTMTVIEGNKSDAVGTRKIGVNARYIRGYIVPKYTDTELTTKETKTVTATALYVRKGAAKTTKALGTVHKGDKLVILEESNGWGKIAYNGGEGWVSLKYLA